MIQKFSHNKMVCIFPVLILCFLFVLKPKIKNAQPDAINDRQRTQLLRLLRINPSTPTAAAVTNLPPHKRMRGRGDKILVETVVKIKVGELEEDLRENVRGGTGRRYPVW